jgi:hypothetical protein
MGSPLRNDLLPPVEFARTKLNRANMAAGTKMLSGHGQRLDLEDAGNPPQNKEIAILAVRKQARS